jgi:CheY-like chemotaxis protein
MSERKPLILYVDDDADIREVVRIILESAGYEMAEAATAEEGVEVYKSRPPDLVIVDLMMEEVDSGTAFVKELRLLGNQVPIYMLSSVGDSMGCRPTTRRSAWPGSSRSRSVATPCSPS